MTKRDVIKCLRRCRRIDDEIQDIKKYEPGNKGKLLTTKKFRDAVMTALNDLPYEYREPIREHYINGFYWEHVRRKCYCSERTCRKNAELGLLLMKERLQNDRWVQLCLARGYIKSG